MQDLSEGCEGCSSSSIADGAMTQRKKAYPIYLSRLLCSGKQRDSKQAKSEETGNPDCITPYSYDKLSHLPILQPKKARLDSIL